MTLTLDQKLAQLDAKRARLIARKRKQDTRQKIIVGALIMAQAEQSPAAARKLLELITAKVTREVDQQAMAPVVQALHRIADHG